MIPNARGSAGILYNSDVETQVDNLVSIIKHGPAVVCNQMSRYFTMYYRRERCLVGHFQ